MCSQLDGKLFEVILFTLGKSSSAGNGILGSGTAITKNVSSSDVLIRPRVMYTVALTLYLLIQKKVKIMFT